MKIKPDDLITIVKDMSNFKIGDVYKPIFVNPKPHISIETDTEINHMTLDKYNKEYFHVTPPNLKIREGDTIKFLVGKYRGEECVVNDRLAVSIGGYEIREDTLISCIEQGIVILIRDNGNPHNLKNNDLLINTSNKNLYLVTLLDDGYPSLITNHATSKFINQRIDCGKFKKVDASDLVHTWWKHDNGDEYEIIMFTNMESSKPHRYQPSIVYKSKSGVVWSKPIDRWNDKMTYLNSGIISLED